MRLNGVAPARSRILGAGAVSHSADTVRPRPRARAGPVAFVGSYTARHPRCWALSAWIPPLAHTFLIIGYHKVARCLYVDSSSRGETIVASPAGRRDY